MYPEGVNGAECSKRNHDWVTKCRDLCEERLSKERFGLIHPEIWTQLPYGHRLIVMRERADEKIGALYVPEQYQMDQSIGWVLVVGMEICAPDEGRYPSVCAYPHPLDLVGRKVTWGQYSGHPLLFNLFGSAFEPGTDSTMRDLGAKDQPKYLEMSIGDLHSEILEEVK